MGIEKIVDIQISIAQAATAQQSFNRALILGDHDTPTDLLKLYSSLAAVAADYGTGTPEYKAANSLFSQNPSVEDVLIGTIVPVPQVTQVVITGDSSSASIDFQVNSETAINLPTTTDIAADTATLLGLINAVSESVAAAQYVNPSDHAQGIYVTATRAFTLTITGHGGSTASQDTVQTADLDIATTLNEIFQSGELGKSWYALVLADASVDQHALDAAAWVEANKRIFIVATDVAAVKTSATDDLCSLLKNHGYLRTFYQWTAAVTEHPDAAVAGYALAHEPGSVTACNKTLQGVSSDSLTDTETGYLDGKNANYYISVAGAGRERVGRMVNAQWLDVVMGVDWIQSDMTTNVFNLLALQDKVPFTDAGIDLVVTQVRLTLQKAVAKGILASFTITAPKASDFSQAEKQSRVLTGVEFTGVLAGAIQKTIIRGVVTA